MMKKYLLILSWVWFVILPSSAQVAVGRYSVADKRQVEFMSSNIEFTPSLYDWHIHNMPTDTLGNSNILHSATTNSIDLFSWSGSTYSNWGISAIIDNLVFGGEFVDWGTNFPMNKGIFDNWYTLSADEWTYLLSLRYNAAALNGRTTVDGTVGWVILADSSLQTIQQNYTSEQWNALAQTGAIFLPISGRRKGGQSVDGASSLYWTSSSNDDKNATAVRFSATDAISLKSEPRCDGGAVRLARRLSVIITIVPGPCEEFAGWTDGNMDNPRTFGPNDPVDVEPILREKIYTISASVSGHGSVTVINKDNINIINK